MLNTSTTKSFGSETKRELKSWTIRLLSRIEKSQKDDICGWITTKLKQMIRENLKNELFVKTLKQRSAIGRDLSMELNDNS
jgi:hypothetical protein